MRLIVWNMGNGGPGASGVKHERAWQFLEELSWDVALLQETRRPPSWAEALYESLVWAPKYARGPTGRILWGCAVVGRSTGLATHQPSEAFPWLRQLEGSTAIARSVTDPRWLVSVHLRAARIPDDVLAAQSIEGVELTTRDRSVWETNVIPHELHRLFGDETFIWAGDLNTDPRMDDKRWFVGGNRRMFEIYAESGSCDTRARFFDDYQQTYVKPRMGQYQLDHVFADARTEGRVTGWEVDLTAVTQELSYSDHAPILVTLD